MPVNQTKFQLHFTSSIHPDIVFMLADYSLGGKVVLFSFTSSDVHPIFNTAAAVSVKVSIAIFVKI